MKNKFTYDDETAIKFFVHNGYLLLKDVHDPEIVDAIYAYYIDTKYRRLQDIYPYGNYKIDKDDEYKKYIQD